MYPDTTTAPAAEWHDFFSVIVGGGPELTGTAVDAALARLAEGADTSDAVVAGMHAARAALDGSAAPHTDRVAVAIPGLPGPPALPTGSVPPPALARPRRLLALTTGRAEG
ncbi:MAG: hypothetical protein QM622_00010 [Microbacterium sp.]|uniref:hypothetical protein n=1 Tax=Microbacterium sp. TaxID=51671 RepID=UPI0039E3A960